ncbi:unnamed protein product, partial [Nesidiocoris tenuis]
MICLNCMPDKLLNPEHWERRLAQLGRSGNAAYNIKGPVITDENSVSRTHCTTPDYSENRPYRRDRLGTIQNNG